jgi:hypothetical protein
MTADERDQLMQFLTSLRQARPQPKDPVADALIRDALAQQPDALYRLVQRCMALQLALDATTAQAASGEAPAASPTSNHWARGLLTQVGGTAMGVTAGVVAGGWLLQGLLDGDLWDGDDA